MNTPLQAALRSQADAPAVSLTDYCGAATAAFFSDPQTEFGALRTGCGAYDLGFRAKISLTGADRVRWLNAMAPHTILALPKTHPLYPFLPHPHHRLLAPLV